MLPVSAVLSAPHCTTNGRRRDTHTPKIPLPALSDWTQPYKQPSLLARNQFWVSRGHAGVCAATQRGKYLPSRRKPRSFVNIIACLLPRVYSQPESILLVGCPSIAGEDRVVDYLTAVASPTVRKRRWVEDNSWSFLSIVCVHYRFITTPVQSNVVIFISRAH